MQAIQVASIAFNTQNTNTQQLTLFKTGKTYPPQTHEKDFVFVIHFLYTASLSCLQHLSDSG